MIIMVFISVGAGSHLKPSPLFPCVLTSLTETLARVACSSDSGQIFWSSNTRNSHHGKLSSEYFITFISANAQLTYEIRPRQKEMYFNILRNVRVWSGTRRVIDQFKSV